MSTHGFLLSGYPIWDYYPVTCYLWTEWGIYFISTMSHIRFIPDSLQEDITFCISVSYTCWPFPLTGHSNKVMLDMSLLLFSFFMTSYGLRPTLWYMYFGELKFSNWKQSSSSSFGLHHVIALEFPLAKISIMLLGDGFVHDKYSRLSFS